MGEAHQVTIMAAVAVADIKTQEEIQKNIPHQQ